jgi:hypothetical protein
MRVLLPQPQPEQKSKHYHHRARNRVHIGSGGFIQGFITRGSSDEVAAGLLAGFAQTAISATLAPAACQRATGQHNSNERG